MSSLYLEHTLEVILSNPLILDEETDHSKLNGLPKVT